MAKGVIYIMTTAVSGLIKIGQTETKQFEERMRHLERNGYYNVVGLKKFFAIEVDNYKEKESMLHKVLARYCIGEEKNKSELFTFDEELARELLMSFDGVVIHPKLQDKRKEIEELTKVTGQNNRFSFYKKGLKDGDVVVFHANKNITATVAGERDVTYLDQTYKISRLAYILYEEMGKLNKSGAYQGAAHFEYQGKLLKDLPDKI